MTRSGDTNLKPYGEGGRALLANDYKAKYSFSIHFNSDFGVMTYGGTEIYIPNDIDLTLARMFAKNLSKIVGYSKNPNFKLEPINFIPFVILLTFDNAPVIPDPMFESIFDINAILDWPGKFFKFLFIRLNYVYINDCNTLKLDATVES
jgi:hypothetical protein